MVARIKPARWQLSNEISMVPIIIDAEGKAGVFQDNNGNSVNRHARARVNIQKGNQDG